MGIYVYMHGHVCNDKYNYNANLLQENIWE